MFVGKHPSGQVVTDFFFCVLSFSLFLYYSLYHRHRQHQNQAKLLMFSKDCDDKDYSSTETKKKSDNKKKKKITKSVKRGCDLRDFAAFHLNMCVEVVRGMRDCRPLLLLFVVTRSHEEEWRLIVR